MIYFRHPLKLLAKIDWFTIINGEAQDQAFEVRSPGIIKLQTHS